MRTLTAFCLALFAGAGAFAQCRPPRYQAGAIFLDSAPYLVRSISIPLRDFVPSSLVCLAASFKERYRGRGSITVNIFSSHKAAQKSLFGQESTRETVETLTQMHARYVLDAAKHEEFVEIMPLGASSALGAGAYGFRIDLPVAAPPSCGLRIGSRCMIALQQFSYPHEPGSKPSGRVTLAGTIARDGGVRHVRAVKTESVPAGGGDLLAHAAVQDLSNWRLEPGPREEAIRITYSYVIDRKLQYDDTSLVDFALPNEVTIRGNPLDCQHCGAR